MDKAGTSRRVLLRSALSAAALLAAAAHGGARAQGMGGGGTAAGDAAFIEQLGNQLVSTVNGPGSIEQKKASLLPLIDQSVAVDEIARFCLGRFWRTATPAQQAEYTRLFHRVLNNNIVGRLGEYRGITFAMAGTQQREGESLVGTVINRPNQRPVNVQWVVGRAGGGAPRIVDVIIEGTSLRLTQRSDYAAYITRNNNSIDALLAAMRQQVGA